MAGRWLKTVVAKQVVFGADSGTVSINLPKSNFIGSLMLRIENVNGSTSNRSETIESGITKIEVIGNGSKVLKSYSGLECRKLAQYLYSDLPPAEETQAGSATQWSLFPIMFGRFFGDEDYILPAKLFSTLQLKITWSFTDSTTVGWTTSESNAKYDITINEYVSADNAKSKKLLVETEINSFTSAASGNKDVELPLGNRYRRIMVRAYEAAIEDGTDITDYELRINNGAQVPMSNTWNQQQLEDALLYKARTTKKVQVDLKDNSTFATQVSRIKKWGAASVVDAHTGGIDAVSGDTVTLFLYDLATPTAISTEEGVLVDVESDIVAHCIMLDFDKRNDGQQLLSTLGLQDLKLRLTQGGAGAAVAVVAQEVMEATTI